MMMNPVESMQPPLAECIICHKPKLYGIHICGQMICLDCERAIVHADVEDEAYAYYVEEMKRIWLSALSL
ncbi:Sigma-G inhibitor, Gin [Alicyclobacillus hesperidum URH17-3-68]|uniref:Inhibitor of sigma-G Gin n=2 Tax=Alicyclobacillus hesperidum TaxID=89784 RepID=A0AA37UDK0_9BACL|nr:Sigma-G inhibitor, Gin [Alicyclobacillus hesperidum URH17-3-68]GLV13949.1 hypothetical protein Heshes_16330 [Alicyclobacillus hesperidum]